MSLSRTKGAGRLVTVFGGSGFVGRYVVRELARDGWRVRVAVRKPTQAYFLKTIGDVGQVQIVQANLRDAESIVRACEGADAVINMVGILFETGRQRFATLQHQGALWAAQAAERALASQFIQISAIGADADNEAEYMQTKAAGEEAVRSVMPQATIIRPSLVFGTEDEFFNRFAFLSTILPVMPAFGGGTTRFQPVYVLDLARGIANALLDPAARGETFEIGGPKIYTLKEIYELVLETVERPRPIVPVPWALARLQGSLLSLLPNPPLTREQVVMLESDNVVGEGVKTIANLGVRDLTTAEAIVPTYLWRFRRLGQFEAEQPSN